MCQCLDDGVGTSGQRGDAESAGRDVEEHQPQGRAECDCILRPEPVTIRNERNEQDEARDYSERPVVPVR